MNETTSPSRGADIDGVLLDLLMAVMDSVAIWVAAARDERRGLAWRDATTTSMAATRGYAPYEEIVADAAREHGLPPAAVDALVDGWQSIEPRPDAAAVHRLRLPYAFVTSSSERLATLAASRSGLEPAFVLSAEAAGCYKPDPRIYLEGVRRLGTPAGRTLYVAGSLHDAVGAARAGLRAVLVRRRLDQPAPPAGVSVAGSLEEVADALDFGRHM